MVEIDVDELVEELEWLRIDVDMESLYDYRGLKRDKFERANKMLDDCIKVVKIFVRDKEING